MRQRRKHAKKRNEEGLWRENFVENFYNLDDLSFSLESPDSNGASGSVIENRLGEKLLLKRLVDSALAQQSAGKKMMSSRQKRATGIVVTLFYY